MKTLLVTFLSALWLVGCATVSPSTSSPQQSEVALQRANWVQNNPDAPDKLKADVLAGYTTLSVAESKMIYLRMDKKRKQERVERAAALKAELAQMQLSPKIRKAVDEGSVILGVPWQAVELIRGAPANINRTVTQYGTSEQWVYSSLYLYFENGILTSWQESR